MGEKKRKIIIKHEEAKSRPVKPNVTKKKKKKKNKKKKKKPTKKKNQHNYGL